MPGDKVRYYHEPHEVLINQSWYDRGTEKSGYWPLLSFQRYGNRLGELFRRWLEKASVLNRMMALLRAAEQNDIGIETRFLFLSQAAEFLHRETIGGSLLPQERFDEIAEALCKALPEGLPLEAAQSFRQKIGFMNEPVLRRRLKELFRAIGNRPTFVADYKTVAGRNRRISATRSLTTRKLKIRRMVGQKKWFGSLRS